MPRKGQVSKRERMPDPKYNDLLVQRFINCVMLDGKKSTATQNRLRGLRPDREKTKEDPLKVFHKAMDNVKPELEVKAQKGRWRDLPGPR